MTSNTKPKQYSHHQEENKYQTDNTKNRPTLYDQHPDKISYESTDHYNDRNYPENHPLGPRWRHPSRCWFHRFWLHDNHRFTVDAFDEFAAVQVPEKAGVMCYERLWCVAFTHRKDGLSRLDKREKTVLAVAHA